MSVINNGSQGIIDLVNNRNKNGLINEGEKYLKTNIPSNTNPCLKCPNAMWFLKNRNINCHCRIMNTIEYSSVNNIEITTCAGIYIAQ